MALCKTLMLVTTGMVLGTVSSRADLTTVDGIWGNNGYGGEWNLYDSSAGTSPGTGIMEYLYGAGNFTRVDDSSDIYWAGSPGGASFNAVYASASQSLYTENLTGTAISQIPLGITPTSGAPSRSGSVVSFTPASQPFLFLDEANGNQASSNPSLSTGDVDRMVTFAVNGYLAQAGVASSYTTFADGTTHYVIAFEDGSDFDYNDLVVEVSNVAPVPEPTTIAAGAFLLLPFAFQGINKLRRNRAA